MAFDLEHWQQKVRAWWAEHGLHIEATPIESAYTLLAASADEPGPAMMALMGIAAGIGSNLVANVVQNAYDRARGGEQAAQQAGEDVRSGEERQSNHGPMR